MPTTESDVSKLRWKQASDGDLGKTEIMKLNTKTISQSLPPALKAFRPMKSEIDQFLSDLTHYLDHIDSNETEENLKTHLMNFLKPTYTTSNTIEQYGDIDFVIRSGGKGTPAAVLFESKRESNKVDMIRRNDLNRKAMHELILYFMRERKVGNTDIRYLVICTQYEFYIFDASVFERTFQKDVGFKKDFEAWTDGKKSDKTTEFFYKEIASRFIADSKVELDATYLDLRTYRAKLDQGADNKELIKLYKLLSPHYLLKKELANDSNSLNKAFYDELLHLIGLEERKKGSKRIIGRLKASKRNSGSLIENTIGQIRYEDDFNAPEIIRVYGNANEEREFNIALELCLTWVNRLLFLKLLEAQIFKFHSQDENYKFLSTSMISDFDDLSSLFFKVLALGHEARPNEIREKYRRVPYLNSSLFEMSELEKKFRVTSLENSRDLPIFKKTILKDRLSQRQKGNKNTLAYIFEFLDAYDFGAAGGSDVQEESKTIINAAVLGLIFEKINGYRDGAIFTPGYITMYMAQAAIERLALEAFRLEYPNWEIKDLDDLKNYMIDQRSKAAILKMNTLIDGLKICDPAVGSGHFLVSCLNELIALKSFLGILADAEGNRLADYHVSVDNDDLIIVNAETDEVFAYQINGRAVPKRIQHVQETLFHEKQKLIENCLFGVDININSVRICQLRLWIELLKNAYYRDGGNDQLETLPNIDINIKCGNSLLSRFALDHNLSDAFRTAQITVSEYRKLVQDYKNTKDKATKKELHERIQLAKSRFQEEKLGSLTKRIDAEIATLRAQEAQEDLFSEDKNQQIGQKNRVDTIRDNIEKLENSRKSLLQEKTFLGAIEWRFEFPEVLDEKGDFVGFDLVIANPPYGVTIGKSVRSHISKSLGKVPDFEIYYLFINLAAAISKDDGSTCQIVPNSVLFNHFAKSYREQILHDWKDIQIDDLTNYTVFDGVVVHNIIFHGKRRIGRDGVEFRRTGIDQNLTDYLRRDREFATSDILIENNRNWGLVFKLEPSVIALVSKMKKSGVCLIDLFPQISQGLIAYDKYQGQSAKIIESRAYHSTVKSKTNAPWLKGEDVTRFRVAWNRKEYVEYSDQLANPRKREFFEQPRILIREITNPRVFAGYSSLKQYNDPALINVLVENDEMISRFALLGILNSKVASFYHFNSSPKATKGAFPKILVHDIKTFPLPEIVGKSDVLKRLSERTVELIELASKSDTSKEFQNLDEENEADVFDLYDLNSKEEAIINQYFEKLKTPYG